MHIAAVVVLVAGVALVLQAVHAERLEAERKNVRIEYRFVPRTALEDQMAPTDLAATFRGMFDDATPGPGGGR
jgi:hypothetical protein